MKFLPKIELNCVSQSNTIITETLCNLTISYMYSFHRNLGKLSHVKWNEMCHFGEMIHNYPYGIVAVRTTQQDCDKIYSNLLPFLLRYGK